MSTSEINSIFKFLFSSIFARKEPYLILGSDDVWIYTNISPSDIIMYVPSIDNELHFLTWKNDKYISVLENKIPNLKNMICCIELSKFNSAINKLGLDNFKLVIEETYLYVVDATTNVKNKCGELISKYVLDLYLAYYKKLHTSLETLISKLDIDIVRVPTSDNIFFIPYTNSSGSIKIPVVDGANVVSIKECLLKLDKPYTICLDVWAYGNSVQTAMEVEWDDIRVISYQPDTYRFLT